jgi:hypothetical protein
MTIRMTTEAFRAMLYGTLSCRCPVTEETEKKLFAELFTWPAGEVRDFAPVQAIIDGNPARTPLHNLLEIASFGQEDPGNFTIRVGHALRALGSTFHFNNLVSGLDPLVVKEVPSFIVSHMLVPVRLRREGDRFGATFTFAGRGIFFAPVFLPPDIAWSADGEYALHMGTIICALDAEPSRHLTGHLSLIPDFAFFCRQVEGVDFTDFQYYGDYVSQVRARFARYFPLE